MSATPDPFESCTAHHAPSVGLTAATVDSCSGNLYLPAALRQLALALQAVAAALQGSPSDAKAFSLTPAPVPCLTVAAAVNEFLIAKAKARRSVRYLASLRVSLGAFARGRESDSLDSVTRQAVETWMECRHWRARTRRGYALDVRTLFNWARRRGLCASNPAEGLDLPEVSAKAPAVHSPAEVAAVLEAARGRDLSACRLLAIRYFAGVRSAEGHRMTESALKLEAGFVEVTAEQSKTRARRLIPICPALAAWLALGGSLPVSRPERLRAAADAAGVAWPSNVTRHSFCSYRLADVRSAAQVALEAGHSEAMLFRHYRELVTPSAAADFWKIRPR